MGFVAFFDDEAPHWARVVVAVSIAVTLAAFGLLALPRLCPTGGPGPDVPDRPRPAPRHLVGAVPFRIHPGRALRQPVSRTVLPGTPPTVKPMTAPPPSRWKAKGAPPWAMATSRTMERPSPEPGRERASAAR